MWEKPLRGWGDCLGYHIKPHKGCFLARKLIKRQIATSKQTLTASCIYSSLVFWPNLCGWYFTKMGNFFTRKGKLGEFVLYGELGHWQSLETHSWVFLFVLNLIFWIIGFYLSKLWLGEFLLFDGWPGHWGPLRRTGETALNLFICCLCTTHSF